MQLQVRQTFARGESKIADRVIAFGGRGVIRGPERSGKKHK